MLNKGFPGGAVVKNLTVNAGDSRVPDLIPGLGRSPGEGNGKLLQDACLENSKDRGAWKAVRTPWSCEELNTTEHIHTQI